MKETLIAGRYAKAIVETHSDAAVLEKVAKEIRRLADLWVESRDLKNVMNNPAFNGEEKKGVMDAVIEASNVSAETGAVMRLLFVAKRIALLPELAEELSRRALAALGKVRVDVTAAAPLSAADTENLIKRLSSFTGKQAVVEVSVDASLIGGVVTRIGSVVYDGSVKNQLAALKAEL